MDELQTIREVLEEFAENGPRPGLTVALAALSRLEARAAEMPDTAEIIESIRGVFPHDGMLLSREECGALIGQYAYRYSEDIRKDRDEWRAFAVRLAGELNDKIAKI